ncbi:MAG: MFS transporter [Ewingella americana]|jgi:MFS family permease|uniref:MFS transporter n=1 Tax=Ewingella americana TaxID=41202 RepID=UPI0024327457|nr:MFS transporter [Ewingella americana]MCI1678286.1 MFS transporter [Ewingella americana]MCI1856077.1 MFS transporter [Ewingella americana]MCI1862302.1 MFS transporter [Ewingella americana]MCI2142745.1 MFS transporter [Ewingella americana]MCI2162536.1 MFS transporter [Ewingella americana]
MTQHYREIFAVPGVLGLVISGTIARLTYAMMGIGIITMLVMQTDHYGLAGTVAGTFTLSSALIAPRVAKFVDSHGQRRVLPWVTAFSTLMLLSLVTAAYLSAPAPILYLLAVLAGTMPSMSAMIRARWAAMFRDSHHLHTAFSLDTVLAEITFIVGAPLAIALSSGLFAEAGPLTAVLLQILGVTAFLMQRKTEPKVVAGGGSDGSSVLRTPGLATIVLVLLTMGVMGGTIDVSAVAFANEHHWPTAASIMLAAYALGSILSGLMFGGLRLSISMPKQFFIGTLLTALTMVPTVFSQTVFALVATLFVAGISYAPTMIVALNIGSKIIAPGRITEGLTWMMTGISVGVAVGAGLAGAVVDHYGARAGLLLGTSAGFIMLIVLVAGWSRLRDASLNS